MALAPRASEKLAPEGSVKLKARVPGCLSWLSVMILVLTQVMISQFVGLSLASGSVVTVLNLLGPLSLSLSLSAPHPPKKYNFLRLFF